MNPHEYGSSTLDVDHSLILRSGGCSNFCPISWLVPTSLIVYLPLHNPRHDIFFCLLGNRRSILSLLANRRFIECKSSYDCRGGQRGFPSRELWRKFWFFAEVRGMRRDWIMCLSTRCLNDDACSNTTDHGEKRNFYLIHWVRIAIDPDYN